MSNNKRIQLATLACLLAAGELCAQPVADFGDAPDPSFPTARFSTSARIAGRVGPYHLDTAKEWIGTPLALPPGPSTTTLEPDALMPGGDADDGAGQVRIARVWRQTAPSWEGRVSVPITASCGAPADAALFINVAADFNRDGRWASYQALGMTQPEWVVPNARIYVTPCTAKTLVIPFLVTDYQVGTEPLPGGPPIWVRVTLTTTPIDPALFGVEGWDGSGPSTGFARGETEDHHLLVERLILPIFTGITTDDTTPPPDPPVPPLLPIPGPRADDGFPPLPPGVCEVNSGARDDFEGVEQGDSECVPSSTAASLRWLSKRNDFEDKLQATTGAATGAELKEKLKTCMHWRAPSYDPQGKLLNRPGVSETNLEICKNVLATQLPITNKRKSTLRGDAITFEYLAAELAKGENVEIFYDWEQDLNGKISRGRHAVSATWALGCGNHHFLEIMDPHPWRGQGTGPTRLLYRVETDAAGGLTLRYVGANEKVTQVEKTLTRQQITYSMSESFELRGENASIRLVPQPNGLPVANTVCSNCKPDGRRRLSFLVQVDPPSLVADLYIRGPALFESVVNQGAIGRNGIDVIGARNGTIVTILAQNDQFAPFAVRGWLQRFPYVADEQAGSVFRLEWRTIEVPASTPPRNVNNAGLGVVGYGYNGNQMFFWNPPVSTAQFQPTWCDLFRSVQVSLVANPPGSYIGPATATPEVYQDYSANGAFYLPNSNPATRTEPVLLDAWFGALPIPFYLSGFGVSHWHGYKVGGALVEPLKGHHRLSIAHVPSNAGMYYPLSTNSQGRVTARPGPLWQVGGAAPTRVLIEFGHLVVLARTRVTDRVMSYSDDGVYAYRPRVVVIAPATRKTSPYFDVP